MTITAINNRPSLVLRPQFVSDTTHRRRNSNKTNTTKRYQLTPIALLPLKTSLLHSLTGYQTPDSNMRRGLLVFLVVNLIIITFLIRSVSTLLSLLLEDASADAIHRAELPSPNSSLIEQRPQVIPKIIHQTYKNETIPEVWRDAQQSCIDLHPDYEYIVLVPLLLKCAANVFQLWTNEKSRDFIAEEYPWFLETFDGYKYPIQRADSIRYFVLAHYGGTYIDLDDVRFLSLLLQQKLIGTGL